MTPPNKLKKFIQASEGGTEIIPPLYAFLMDEKLPDPLTVKVTGHGRLRRRKPDGWFHPSGHPLMTARQLYFYLTEPDKWRPQEFDYTIKMSALIGSVVHEIVEAGLTKLGFLIVPEGTCVACGKEQPRKCREHGAIDEETGSRGHMDGKLGVGGKVRGFELKTAWPLALRNIDNNDVVAFRAKWPYYYAQVQEYMRMTGLTEYKVIFWTMGNPWEMREFTIQADLPFQAGVRKRYLEARQAVADGAPPMEPCCWIGSPLLNQCPAMGCSMKRMA